MIHPDETALRALSLGQLSEAELGPISAHLGDCPECCQRIDLLATDDRLLARLQESAASRDEVIVTPVQRRSAVRALRHAHDSKVFRRAEISEAKQAPLPAPRQVGDYDILEEVGRGGMGVVYKARHRGLHRLAALKMILAGEFASSAQDLRFRLEAELAARVQHPNIVQVYEIGSFDGRPFLALEWVEGGSLANRLDGKPWPPDEAAALIETLARAIDVAHNEGVIHRDLKPANILLKRDERRGMRDEKVRMKDEGRGMKIDEESTSFIIPDDPTAIPDAKDNRNSAECVPSFLPHPSFFIPFPKITDFGLAQPIEGGRTMTQSGFLVGTPGYMAPEQAGGKRALVGAPTDIYALGVMLYQLITGELPFQRDSTLELLRAITSDEPPRPRRLQPRIPRDLEAITLHCLEKEPAKRYASAVELADDLRRFQVGEVITARQPSRIERTAKFVRRYKSLVGGAAATAVALVMGTVFSLLFAFGEARQREEAERNGRLVQREAYQARLSAGMMALQENNLLEAAFQLDAAPQNLRGWEWQHLHARVSDSSPIALHAGPEFDGFYAHFPPGKAVIARKDHRYVLLDVQRRSILRDLCADTAFRGVASSSTGALLVYADGHGGTTLLDDAGTEIHVPITLENSNFLCLSRDRKLLALHPVANEGRQLHLFEIPSGRLRLTLERPEDMYRAAFSPDGTLLAGGSKDQGVVVWNTTTGAKTILHGHTGRVYSVDFHPNGKRILSGSLDNNVRQWDLSTGQAIDIRRGHSNAVLGVTYSPDGKWFASSSDDGTVRIWKTDDNVPPTVLQDNGGRVFESHFSSDGFTISTQSDSQAPWWIWPTPAALNRQVLRGHSSFVYPVAFSPDGRLLASAGWDDDHGIRLWDAASSGLVAVLKGHKEEIFSLAFSPDGRRLVSRGDDATLRVWNIDTGAALTVKPCDHVLLRGSPYSVVVTQDGRTILTGAADGLRRWDLATGDEQSGLPLPLHNVRVLAQRQQDGLLAASGDEGSIVLFDLNARQVQAVLSLSSGSNPLAIHSLAFSPDGRQLLSAGGDNDIHLWDVESGTQVRVLHGHTSEVFAAVFHPDGQRIVSAGRDRMIRVWDPAQGDELVRLLGHTSYVFSLSFSPDGATLASGSGDFTVRLWETERLGRRLDAEREEQAARPAAERLLERLFREFGTADQVAKRLRTETVRNGPLERATRNALYRRQGVAPP